MANFVQEFRSTDLNAPVLSGTTGAMLTVLNACLVDGYTPASITSITESGSNYTMVIPAANITLLVNEYIKIASCTTGAINGVWKITSVNAAGTSIVFTGPGGIGAITVGPGTYAKAPIGWTRPFAAGTNSQTYRAPGSWAGTNQFYFQGIDNAALAGSNKEMQAYGAEVMTADQTISSGRFPTAAQFANGYIWTKSDTASDAGARKWSIIGDNYTFYMQTIRDIGNVQYSTFGFGEYKSFKSGGSSYCSFISGLQTTNVWAASDGAFTTPAFANTLTSNAVNIVRGASGTGTAQTSGFYCLAGAGAYNGRNPSRQLGGIEVMPYLVVDGTASNVCVIGRLRGVYNIGARWPAKGAAAVSGPYIQFNDNQTVTLASNPFGGTTMSVWRGNDTGSHMQVLVDRFGPWT